MDSPTLLALVLSCAPDVQPRTAQALIAVESSANPYAIGVVGGTLDHQPRSRAEALATAKALQTAGWNFSVGLAQINVRNLERLGIGLEAAFDPCTNLQAMQTILADCHARAGDTAHNRAAQHRLRRALSCYYSGNFTTGFNHGYVRRVAHQAAHPQPSPVQKESP
jgi:type IV secretion system protein VirB1